MNTPDKCPQCGAEIMEVGAKGDWTAYLCESYIGVHAKDDFSQSDYCRERAAHAATKQRAEELQKACDAYDAACTVQLENVETLKAALAATKQELVMWKNNAGTAVTVAIERIQTQRDAALARVRELEGLRVIDNHSDAFSVRATIQLPGNWWPEKGKTLGEAMPRKEGV